MAAVRSDSLQTGPRSQGPAAPSKQRLAGLSYAQWLVAAVAMVSLAVWCYLPTIVTLVGVWNREPDYSHGFLVVPLAIWFLWARRDRYPVQRDSFRIWGWLLIALGLAMRWLGARYYMEALDGWSIPVWLGGVVGVFAGWRVFTWTLPSLAFLFFAVPLPFSAERALSLPLQHIAAQCSCWFLQMLGEPALAMGNTIVIGEHQLEVEHACSGLRIFVGIAALAYAYVVLAGRCWWEKCLLMIAVVPIALISNVARIVVTAYLYRHVSVEAGKQFTHDAAGWGMIVLAAVLFGLVLGYLKWLVRDYRVVDVGDLIRHVAASQPPGASENRL